MLRVGVLGLQGGVEEHVRILSQIEGVLPVEVRRNEDLEKIDGLIIPGGESTTIGKLLNRLNMTSHIQNKIDEGLPVWGTCAGMILLANHIEGQSSAYLKKLSITVSRNAFGRQLDSFDKTNRIPEISEKPIKMRFIRAPKIIDWNKETVEVLYEIEGCPVAVREGSLLATSFHPELVDEKLVHQYFVGMINKI